MTERENVQRMTERGNDGESVQLKFEKNILNIVDPMTSGRGAPSRDDGEVMTENEDMIWRFFYLLRCSLSMF